MTQKKIARRLAVVVIIGIACFLVLERQDFPPLRGQVVSSESSSSSSSESSSSSVSEVPEIREVGSCIYDVPIDDPHNPGQTLGTYDRCWCDLNSVEDPSDEVYCCAETALELIHAVNEAETPEEEERTLIALNDFLANYKTDPVGYCSTPIPCEECDAELSRYTPECEEAELEPAFSCLNVIGCNFVGCNIHIYNRNDTTAENITVTLELDDNVVPHCGQGSFEPLGVMDNLDTEAGFVKHGTVAAETDGLGIERTVTWEIDSLPAGHEAASWLGLILNEAGESGTMKLSVQHGECGTNPSTNLKTQIVTADPQEAIDYYEAMGYDASSFSDCASFATKANDPVNEVCHGDKIFYTMSFGHEGATKATVIDQLDPCLDTSSISAMMPGDCQIDHIRGQITCSNMDLMNMCIPHAHSDGSFLAAVGQQSSESTLGQQGEFEFGILSFAIEVREDNPCAEGTIIENTATVYFNDSENTVINTEPTTALHAEELSQESNAPSNSSLPAVFNIIACSDTSSSSSAPTSQSSSTESSASSDSSDDAHSASSASSDEAHSASSDSSGSHSSGESSSGGHSSDKSSPGGDSSGGSSSGDHSSRGGSSGGDASGTTSSRSVSSTPLCGNFVEEGSEECDQGTSNSDTIADRCRTDCTLPSCGDGVKDAAEDCDDGNRTTGDGCNSQCHTEHGRLNLCGNSVLNTGEECDDGNTLSGDGCSDTCISELVSTCGNGKIELREECDDGNRSNGDGCSGSCFNEIAYRGLCGNNAVEVPEQCDDGNVLDGDACNSACRIETETLRTVVDPLTCGNGVLNGLEQCDDGNIVNGDGCSSTCALEAGTQVICGDGIVTANEWCDDGNTTDGDGCDRLCRLEGAVASAFCSDGVIQPGEECDDKNRRDLDGCNDSCFLEVGFCGDGIVQRLFNEQCEPRTHLHDDYGCDRDCQFEVLYCGNDALDPGEECDRGSDNSDSPDFLCRSNCRRARCGDRILDTGEECDDGNNVNGDGCGAWCLREAPSAPSQPDTPFPPLPRALDRVPPVGSVITPIVPTVPVSQRPPLGETGPAIIAVMAAGAAAGVGYIRRKRKK